MAGKKAMKLVAAGLIPPSTSGKPALQACLQEYLDRTL
jgi:hypothetical protein